MKKSEVPTPKFIGYNTYGQFPSRGARGKKTKLYQTSPGESELKISPNSDSGRLKLPT